ncbi:MAG: hypothetical protein AB1563_00115 [Bacillota bacterium]
MTQLSLESLSSVAQILGALATIVIAALTLCQSRQNAAQLEEMKKNRRAEYGPWLTLELGFREEFRQPKGIFDDPPERFDLGIIAKFPIREKVGYGVVSSIEVTLENKGRGPAYNVNFQRLGDAKLDGIIPIIGPDEFKQVYIQVHHGKERVRSPMLLVITYENVSGEVFEQQFPLIIEQHEFIKLYEVGFSKPRARA